MEPHTQILTLPHTHPALAFNFTSWGLRAAVEFQFILPFFFLSALTISKKGGDRRKTYTINCSRSLAQLRIVLCAHEHTQFLSCVTDSIKHDVANLGSDKREIENSSCFWISLQKTGIWWTSAALKRIAQLFYCHVIPLNMEGVYIACRDKEREPLSYGTLYS